MPSAKVTDNTGAVKNQLLVKSNIFLRLMGDSIGKIADPNTPKKTGRLRMDRVVQVLGTHGKIVWGKDYAARMEQVQFKNYTTAGTGPHYAEDAIEKAVQDTARIAKIAGLI